jgi:hypothetical protein
MSKETVPGKAKRDTSWHSKKGIARRELKSGTEWGFYSKQLHRIVGGFKTKDDAVAAKAKDERRSSPGFPRRTRPRRPARISTSLTRRSSEA